jgi:hypothetical protein
LSDCGSVTKEAQTHLIRSTQLGAQPGAHRHRHETADDARFAEAAAGKHRQMHRAALAAADPRGLAEKLGHQRRELRALADGMTVRTMIARHVVVVAHGHAGADDLGLLAVREMPTAGDLLLVDHSLHALFEDADAEHASKHLLEYGGGQLWRARPFFYRICHDCLRNSTSLASML